MGEATRQETFDREFRAHIERHRSALISALRTITTATPPAEVKLLAFEIQPYWDEFPVYLHAMDDESPDETYYEPPFSDRLLEDAGELIPDGAIDQDSYEDAGVATIESGARVLARWFGECWHAAGGASFPLPAYINLHDSSSYYDLRSSRWVKNSDIWP
jgi:hypothetical protein